MATVQSTRSKKYELSTSFGEEPTVHVESEGERLIHDLCVKQLDTNLTLEQQKKQEKQFERGSGFVPLSVHGAGSCTLEEVKSKALKEERLEELIVLGLTAKEANAVLNGEDLTFPQSRVETSVKKARASQIRQIIAERYRNVLCGESQERDRSNRHERELALAVKPNSTETKLFQFALSCQNYIVKDTRPLNHPINRLDELEKALFKRYDPIQAANTVRRKRRQILEGLLPPIGPKYVKQEEDNDTKRSLWDQEVETEKTADVKTSSLKTCACKNKTLYAIRNGEIIEINKINSNDLCNAKKDLKKPIKGSSFVNTETFTDSCAENVEELPKLSVNEIRNIARFKDYEKGLRSKVLYVKNLSKAATEEDLVKLFQRFQLPGEPSIIYRLTGGKMRGQAFVTFSDERVAEEALDAVNGCILKGKPLIIAFGKT